LAAAKNSAKAPLRLGYSERYEIDLRAAAFQKEVFVAFALQLSFWLLPELQRALPKASRRE
jgi:hypothetical protein